MLSNSAADVQAQEKLWREAEDKTARVQCAAVLPLSVPFWPSTLADTPSLHVRPPIPVRRCVPGAASREVPRWLLTRESRRIREQSACRPRTTIAPASRPKWTRC